MYEKLITNILNQLPDTKEKSEAFGSSLLLSNSPLSPKVVNGSFAAIFDADEFLAKTYAGIRIAVSKIQRSRCSRLPTNLSTSQHSTRSRRRRDAVYAAYSCRANSSRWTRTWMSLWCAPPWTMARPTHVPCAALLLGPRRAAWAARRAYGKMSTMRSLPRKV